MHINLKNNKTQKKIVYSGNLINHDEKKDTNITPIIYTINY